MLGKDGVSAQVSFGRKTKNRSSDVPGCTEYLFSRDSSYLTAGYSTVLNSLSPRTKYLTSDR